MASDQILTVAQMRAAEQSLIDAGESVESLMEIAGAGVADWAWRMAAGRPVTVLCGPGNNGGDGYVAARELLARGSDVRIVAPYKPATPAAIAAQGSYSGPIVADASGGVLVDCLFGSGLSRPLDEQVAQLLRNLAAHHHLRIAVDLPSGVESDSGALLNQGLPQYDLTIALGAWKFAHWLMPSSSIMGARRFVDIGVGEVANAARLLDKPKLVVPAPDAHKYSRGFMAVIGGALPGAGVLAAKAAMRGGAGYVKLFADARPSSAPDDLVVETGDLPDLLADFRFNALLLGPGLGQQSGAEEELAAVLACDLPMVLDADALRLLAPGMLDKRTAPLILTPHAGELTSLLENFEIEAGTRTKQARDLARAANAIVVAKGPDTLIAAPGGSLAIAPPAPSWLAAAGSGDVLAGLIASRLASGESPEAAAAQAVWLHGEAARLAGPAFTATGLIDSIPEAYGACL